MIDLKPYIRSVGSDGFEFFDPAINDFQRECNRLTEAARIKSRKKSGLTWAHQYLADEHAAFIKANT